MYSLLYLATLKMTKISPYSVYGRLMEYECGVLVEYMPVRNTEISNISYVLTHLLFGQLQNQHNSQTNMACTYIHTKQRKREKHKKKYNLVNKQIRIKIRKFYINSN